ncbi:MAG TPA: AAA family ATPase [Ruminiclostridium sp.]
MYIDNILFKEHAVFGLESIYFNKSSIRLNRQDPNRLCSEISINLKDDSKGYNHYTFIIGDNGVGKSLLFKTLLNFIYANVSLKTSRSYWTDSFHYLISLGIYNYWDRNAKSSNSDFLERYDMVLLYISSNCNSVKKNNYHRCYEYNIYENNSDFLILKALYKKASHLDKLADLLRPSGIMWDISWEISTIVYGEISEDLYSVLLKGTRDINIITFLNLIQVVKNNTENDLLPESIPKELYQIFNAIINNRYFQNELNSVEKSYKSLFNEISESTVVASIYSFVNTDVDTNGVEEFMNVRISKQAKTKWDNLATPITSLREYDLWVIQLLKSLELIEFDVTCNNIPVKAMSSGEQIMIKLFSYFSNLPNDRLENIIVLYDEPENSLHPKWQQQFPFIFKQVTEDIYEIKNSHFIFATHSPLLIMNSEKVNNLKSSVLRFEKDKEGFFKSTLVKNIDKYCIEQLMLDEFDVKYRSMKKEEDIKTFLTTKINEDPSVTIQNSYKLKQQIDLLHAKLIQESTDEIY